MNIQKICTIVTHYKPHLDEILAYWLSITFGKKLFPGVEKATIQYVSAGSKAWEGKTSEYWLKKGYLALGVWFGMFDEHANKELKKANKDACTATLVAKYLGVEDYPALQSLLDFTLNTNQNPVARPFDLSSAVKDLHGTFSSEEVLEKTLDLITAKYNQEVWFMKAREELDKKATIVALSRNRRLCVIRSDNGQMHKAAFKKGYDIVVLFKKDGHVLIFSNHRAQKDFYKVAAIIRNMEDQKREQRAKVVHSKVWHLNEQRNALFNGTETSLDVPVTVLSQRRIIRAIELVYNPQSSCLKAKRQALPRKDAPKLEIVPEPTVTEEKPKPATQEKLQKLVSLPQFKQAQ